MGLNTMKLNKEQLWITRNVFHQIEQTIGIYPPECGGIIGAKEDGIISEFYFDRLGKRSFEVYSPDVESINSILVNDWMPHNIYMVGIVHSHRGGLSIPSCADVAYGLQILHALDTVDSFYLPIVTRNQNMEIHGYIICRDDGRCRELPISII